MPEQPQSTSWLPVLASSGVLSFALLGDALLYAVLPVHAAAFGITLAWVGILLSANRFIRVFAYGYIARLGEVMGYRSLCIWSCAGAVISTAMYGVADGEWALLAARCLWGLSYAALVLVTLAYSVRVRAEVGSRVGWSRAIQRLGPLLALVGGAWLTGILGPRTIFLWLAVLTALALPLALSLPRTEARDEVGTRKGIRAPSPLDWLFFLQGFAVDGVFALSITIVLARTMPIDLAVVTGGTLLAMRHVGEAVAAPMFGKLADQFGAARLFLLSMLITAAGFALVAASYTITGALTMLVFRGSLAATGPATIVQDAGPSNPVMGDLANMQAWRDLGAAVGPLGTGVLLGSVAANNVGTLAQDAHGILAVVLVAASLWWWLRRRQRL